MRQTGGGAPILVKHDVDDEALLNSIDPVIMNGIKGIDESFAAFDFPEGDYLVTEDVEGIIVNDEEKEEILPLEHKEEVSPQKASVPGVDFERQDNRSLRDGSQGNFAPSNYKTEAKENYTNSSNSTKIEPHDDTKRSVKPGFGSTRSSSAKRLNEAMTQSEDMTSIMKQHTRNKKIYYDKKLEIMAKNSQLNERNTRALETIASALRRH